MIGLPNGVGRFGLPAVYQIKTFLVCFFPSSAIGSSAGASFMIKH
jgi:hypothetical protein